MSDAAIKVAYNCLYWMIMTWGRGYKTLFKLRLRLKHADWLILSVCMMYRQIVTALQGEECIGLNFNF